MLEQFAAARKHVGLSPRGTWSVTSPFSLRPGRSAGPWALAECRQKCQPSINRPSLREVVCAEVSVDAMFLSLL